MKSRIHKWVLNAIAITNPKQISKSGKYVVKTRNREWFEIGAKLVLISMSRVATNGNNQ